MNPKARPMANESIQSSRVRLDKWLWAARLFKTRGLAAEDIDHGRVAVNGQVAKASRELRPGDLIAWRQGGVTRTFSVLALSNQRGPAPVAQLLYQETPESVAARERAALARRQGVEPATAIDQGRPTKRDRRQLADWNRWSASIEDLASDHTPESQDFR
jgi:ribosome-associated heat shock protein Hsp15